MNVSLDGYPLDMFKSPGWKVAVDIVTTAILLLVGRLSLFGIYFLGLRAVLWIAKFTQ